MERLSPHFTRAEFACNGEGRPGHRSHPVEVSGHLVEHLEELRALKGGRPLVIISGHRCQYWNHRVGGATESQHVRGTAADIPEGYATTEEAEAAGFTGIGSRGRWAVHVDVRPQRTRWTY